MHRSDVFSSEMRCRGDYTKEMQSKFCENMAHLLYFWSIKQQNLLRKVLDKKIIYAIGVLISTMPMEKAQTK